jgi:hypothetical protein
MALVIGMYVARRIRVARIIELIRKVMKTNTTKNLTSAVMFVILTPFLALAMLLNVKASGVAGNDTLLLLLVLSGAVLSGINGFGRRTAKAIPLSPAQEKGVRAHNLSWSTRQSTNA